MTIAVQNAPFVEYTDKLREMAEVLQTVAVETPNLKIEDLLEKAALICGTTPPQMKYALSFAGVKRLVLIDYDSATVSAID